MSFWPGIISQGIAPPSPTFSVVSRTIDSITWKIDNYNSTVEGYVNFSSPGGGTFSAVSINAGVATFTHSGLTAATSYTVSAQSQVRGFLSDIGTSAAAFTLPLAPSLTLSSQTANSITWTISTNYDSTYTYSFSGTGTFSRTGSTVVQSGLNGATSYTITGTATKNGVSNTGPASAPALTAPATPVFSVISRSPTSISWRITTGYYASATYSLTASAGTISRSGDTISHTGLTTETSYTLSGTSTLNGLTSSTGSNSAVTSPTPPAAFTTSSAKNSITVTIGGYSTNYSYRATATAGSVPSISSNTFTITDLTASQTITITLYRTRNGAESSGTSQNATTTAAISFSMNALVVAGGGAGGYFDQPAFGQSFIWGGGGGGGGVLIGPMTVSTDTSYTIQVGAGGANASNGSNSVFGPRTASGGGFGGSYKNGSFSMGNPGGSGGGGQGVFGYYEGSGGFGISGQGFNGGPGDSLTTGTGGGGGGASSAGYPADDYNTITNSGLSMAGSGKSGSPLNAGTFGGGGSSNEIASPGGGGILVISGPSFPSSQGQINSGGGGGGVQGVSPLGSTGGSGIVVLSIPPARPATFSPGLTRSPSTATTGVVTITAGSGTVSFL